MNAPLMNLKELAACLGGKVSGDRVLAPGPGHSPDDLSLSVWLDPDAPDGFTTHTFTDDDFARCRDHVKALIGRAPVTSPSRTTVASPKPKPIRTFEYVYRRADGAQHFKVLRQEFADVPKQFPMAKFEGGSWVWRDLGSWPKIPFRLPELLTAPDADVFIVEGEKKCLRAVEALGIQATTMWGGSKAPWSDELNQYFLGRRVFILPDNDQPGESHAEKVRAALLPVASEIRIVRLPGLPPKGGDVADWIDAGGTHEQLMQLVAAAPLCDAEPPLVEELAEAHDPPDPNALPAICAADLRDRPLVQRSWVVPGLVPAGTTTTLDGDGGLGKSLLALQLCVAVAIGATWLARPVEKGRALYLSAEDDLDEIQRRLSRISASYECEIGELTDLTIVPLAEHGISTELMHLTGRERDLVHTPTWTSLVALIKEKRPTLIVLDARADVFGGDEINRLQVRQFMTNLRRLAQANGAAILMLAHPSLTQMSTGAGSSGSTAWNNSVRSRLYLTLPKAERDEEPDPALRLLSLKKSNYGPGEADLVLRMEDGVLELDAGSSAARSPVKRTDDETDQLFMDLLTTYAARGQDLSPAPTSPKAYAPTVLAKDERAKKAGVQKIAFERSMARLLDAGRLQVEMRGRTGHEKKVLVQAKGDLFGGPVG